MQDAAKSVPDLREGARRSSAMHQHMIDRSILGIFDSFEAADEADRLARWSMTPGERLEAVKMLRHCHYPDGKTAPSLQRVLESAELEKR